MSVAKKAKNDNWRSFQEAWTESAGVIEWNGKALAYIFYVLKRLELCYCASEWDSSPLPFRRWTFRRWRFRRWNVKCVFLWNVTKVQKFALLSSGKPVSVRVSPGPQPAWDTRRGEEFSERGPKFLNYVQ